MVRERLRRAPASFVVASDSHSNMYGALAAVGTPVVRTDAAAIWATGDVLVAGPAHRPGRARRAGCAPGVTGKDVIITLCGLYNHDEVLNAAVEFAGPGIAALSMDARMTIANMTTEWGALVGWFPFDAVTIAAYLRQRARDPRRPRRSRPRSTRADDRRAGRRDPPRPTRDAAYAAAHHARPRAR